MAEDRETRVLVLMEHIGASPALLEAIRERAARGPTRFRIVVPNPARAELHLLHPERHDKAVQAEEVLHDAMPAIVEAAGAPVVGSVSVRHDLIDVVEEILFSEPVDEIVLSIVPHGMKAWLHQDLAHRLGHFHLPVTTVPEGARV
jgi:hypothetical protein